MSDLGGFRRRIEILASQIEGNTETLIKKLALEADKHLVMATPVDTGRARSNWIVQINSPFEQNRAPYSPGEQRSTEAQNTASALEQGEGAIMRYRIGNVIYISNNVPYMMRLDEGYSAQAPANFIKQAVIYALNSISGDRIT